MLPTLVPDPDPTIDAALRAASNRLAVISDSPWLDAQRIVEHVLERTASQIIASGHERLDDATAHRIADLISRRCQGEPLAYITGRAGFWTLDLTIAPPVLVPRPDTETLVAAALDALPADRACRIADLGTGSGAIALALASERPAWRVIATDQCATALTLAQTNCERLGLDNVEIRAGDWFEPINGQRFDAIVSNPPYIAPDDRHLADPALAHESPQALIADNNGLAAIHRIAAGAVQHLSPGGWLALEHGAEQAAAVRRTLQQHDFSRIETRRDLAGNQRVSLGALG